MRLKQPTCRRSCRPAAFRFARGRLGGFPRHAFGSCHRARRRAFRSIRIIQQRENFAQTFFYFKHRIFLAQTFERKIHLPAVLPDRGQSLSRARNGLFLFIEQSFELENKLDIFHAINTIALPILLRS